MERVRMSARKSWVKEWEESARGAFPDGTLVLAVNEYRPWAQVEGKLEENGCPKCGAKLFDRLTHIYYMRAEGPSMEYHLNSGPDLERLRSVEITEWDKRKVFLRNGEIVLEKGEGAEPRGPA